METGTAKVWSPGHTLACIFVGIFISYSSLYLSTYLSLPYPILPTYPSWPLFSLCLSLPPPPSCLTSLFPFALRVPHTLLPARCCATHFKRIFVFCRAPALQHASLCALALYLHAMCMSLLAVCCAARTHCLLPLFYQALLLHIWHCFRILCAYRHVFRRKRKDVALPRAILGKLVSDRDCLELDRRENFSLRCMRAWRVFVLAFLPRHAFSNACCARGGRTRKTFPAA